MLFNSFASFVELHEVDNLPAKYEVIDVDHDVAFDVAEEGLCLVFNQQELDVS